MKPGTDVDAWTDHQRVISKMRLCLQLHKSPQEAPPVLSADRTTLLTEKSQILQRWMEDFQSILNQLSTISNAAIDRLIEVETNAKFELVPSLQENIGAVQ
ncbi:unnamed protein product [Schistocephalus solidus]|uniref:Uncharacterized protein n=1 Tax=Schistocephalus solidus TaxID=70667 RepID=A0A183SXQ0_SCHSO|nr:unnamed protein product [Schistocephalus solidus]